MAPPSPPPKQLARLTPEQMHLGIDRLTRVVDRVRQFDPQTVTEQYNIPQLHQLSAAIEEALARTFGPDTLDYERYKLARDFDNGPHNYAFKVPIADVRKSLERSKQSNIALLEQAIETLRERFAEHGYERPSEAPGTKNRKVFVVHGHDGAAREAMARFLEKIELEAIILHEQPDRGLTIIEKFETHASQVRF